MCHTSDLSMLLQSLLSIHRHTKFSTTAAFSSLLSTILKHLTQQGGSTSTIPAESTAALLDLWQEQPSDDLDSIVLDVVRGRLWPNAMVGTVQPLDLTAPGVFDRAMDSLQESSLFEDVEHGLVDFILQHLNHKRSLILAALMTASSAFRDRFSAVVQKLSGDDLQARVEDTDFITLLHAYMSRVSHRTKGSFQWSSSATAGDRRSVIALRPMLLAELVQQVANATYSSEESTLVAEVAAMVIALTTMTGDEEDVESQWQLLESVPRIGLDTIQILETLLAITRGIAEDRQVMERQDKIVRWFEETARQLIVVLDKSGDAEWLEAVCDRLYSVLDEHVLERKVSIDQKVLFELVSFAIEKALDNVQLVRFSAFLAKKYYVEVRGCVSSRRFTFFINEASPKTHYLLSI